MLYVLVLVLLFLNFISIFIDAALLKWFRFRKII